jgi:hypothetical protein
MAAVLASAGCVSGVPLGAEDAGVDAHREDDGEAKRDAEPKDGGRVVDGTADASKCASGALGNAGGACSTDDSFFLSATAACTGSTGFLSSFKADEKCGAGSSSSATYACCATAPMGAASGGFGNANGMCDPDTTLFTSAEQDCTSQGQSIVGFVPSESCGQGSSSSGSYTCAR